MPTLKITVGAGGAGCRKSENKAAGNGLNSSIEGASLAKKIEALGGGLGASEGPTASANTGGSGGGGAEGPGTDAARGKDIFPGGPGQTIPFSGEKCVYAAGGLGRFRNTGQDGNDAVPNTGNGGEGGGESIRIIERR